MKININIVGLGFVGLTTALGFAYKKYPVVCVENNLDRLNLIKKGKVPFKEPGLEKILKKYKKKYCLFSKNPIIKRDKINLVFICVGTPCKKNGDVNLEYIKKAILSIQKNTPKYFLKALLWVSIFRLCLRHRFGIVFS